MPVHTSAPSRHGSSILTRFTIDLDGELREARATVALVDCLASLPGHLTTHASAGQVLPIVSAPLPTEPWAKAGKTAARRGPGEGEHADLVRQACQSLRARWPRRRQWANHAAVHTERQERATDSVQAAQASLFGVLKLNEEAHDVEVHLDNEQGEGTHPPIWLPRQSGFLITNLLPSRDSTVLPAGWDAVLKHVQARYGVDLLIIDPPYPNHSAERLSGRLSRKRKRPLDASLPPTPPNQEGPSPSRGYETMPDLYDLWALKQSVKLLLDAGTRGRRRARGTLVAVWVTHNPKAKRFVLDKLFPAWRVTFLHEAVWIKICASSGTPLRRGEDEDDQQSGLENGCQPVFEEGSGRKAYELLLLGRYHGESLDATATATPPLAGFAGKVTSRQGRPSSTLVKDEAPKPAMATIFDDDRTHEDEDDDGVWTWRDPDEDERVVIASVPVGHSTKPYLVDVLAPFLRTWTSSSRDETTSSSSSTSDQSPASLPPAAAAASGSYNRDRHRRRQRSSLLVVDLFARGVTGVCEEPEGLAEDDGDPRRGEYLAIGGQAVERNIIGRGVFLSGGQ